MVEEASKPQEEGPQRGGLSSAHRRGKPGHHAHDRVSWPPDCSLQLTHGAVRALISGAEWPFLFLSFSSCHFNELLPFTSQHPPVITTTKRVFFLSSHSPRKQYSQAFFPPSLRRSFSQGHLRPLRVTSVTSITKADGRFSFLIICNP